MSTTISFEKFNSRKLPTIGELQPRQEFKIGQYCYIPLDFQNAGEKTIKVFNLITRQVISLRLDLVVEPVDLEIYVNLKEGN